jgi:mannose-6-phosphate isomerase-like protein (cupin superfamily)
MARQDVTRRNGSKHSDHYLKRLQSAAQEKERAESLKKVIKRDDMPVEDSPHGLLTHIMNEDLNARFYSVDAYIQELLPGASSGKHRHVAEECVYILEGKGFDLHWDPEVELSDRYHWSWPKEPKRFDWEKGDCIYIPPNTIHQHFNSDESNPARFISATNRVYRHIGYGDIEQLEEVPNCRPKKP